MQVSRLQLDFRRQASHFRLSGRCVAGPQRNHGHHPRQAPPAPRKGPQARHAGAAQAGLDPGEGAGVLAAVRRDARDPARARPRHGVRGGRLPQHRRVLGGAARHHDDHGRYLHARVCVLQRQDRAAGRARCRRAGERGAGRGEAGARSYRHHVGRPGRPGRRRGRAFRRHHPSHSRADAERRRSRC